MEQYDVFISYSRKDIEIADRIEEELKKYGISYFIDRTDIDLGEDFARKIAECIYNCDTLLFVWSENSNQSKNTANEIMLAIEFDKTIVPFKIGKFKPDFNLAYNLVRFNRIDAVEFNEAQICSMAAKLAAQLGKSKISDTSKQNEPSKSVSNAVKDTSASDTVLKVLTDTECRVSVDYEEKGIARPRQILHIPLCAGSYCLLFESTADKNNFIEDTDFNISAHTEKLYKVKLKKTADVSHVKVENIRKDNNGESQKLKKNPSDAASSLVSGRHHDYVDLGLPSGIKWATCNVGASSPEEYGSYFAWGDTSEKSEYTKHNSFTFRRVMPDISGNPKYDAARCNWGGSWRIPTQKEIKELFNNCDYKWTTYKGVKGYMLTSKKNGKELFLPAAGGRYGTSLDYAGEGGYYWSSTPHEDCDDYAYGFGFGAGGGSWNDWYGRYNGRSVRPVSE